jgi:hypothetical protein
VGFLLLIEEILLSPLSNGRYFILTGHYLFFNTKNVNTLNCILWDNLHDLPHPLIPPE